MRDLALTLCHISMFVRNGLIGQSFETQLFFLSHLHLWCLQKLIILCAVVYPCFWECWCHGELSRGGLGGAPEPLPQGENSLKQGPKPKQIVKCGGGHWNSPLWAVLKFKHQSVIWTFWVCTNRQKVCSNIWVTHKLKTGGSNTIIA